MSFSSFFFDGIRTFSSIGSPSFSVNKYKRERKNDRGEVLLQPVVEIPASEAWLFRNKEAFESVKKGLKDASEGKISKLNLKDL